MSAVIGVAALSDAVTCLREARTAVVCGHVNPDGDALGSLLAVTVALREIGIDAQPSWGGRDRESPPAPVEGTLSFLPLLNEVVPPDEVHDRPDVVVCCDTASAGRLGTLQWVLDRAGTVMVLDHHVTGDGFGDIRVVDPTASSTGVLALDLIDALDVPLTPEIANALYLAVLTDTGRFSFAATSPADHRVAARLIEAGADHVGIARAVYDTASSGFLSLVARVTGRAVVDPALVWSMVTLADLTESGARPEETDALIELLRRVETADVTLMLRETESGSWRCSLRSRGATDVTGAARAFGGGGHRAAAGFTADGQPEAIAAEVRRRLGGQA